MTPFEITIIVISFGTLLIMFILFFIRTIKRGDLNLFSNQSPEEKKKILKKPATVKKEESQKSTVENKNKPAKKRKPCILCGTLLQDGESIKSKKFKGEETTIVHIYGCPHCYGELADKNRICPRCKNELKFEEHMMGKMQKTEEGKLRIHVSGCTKCTGSKH